MIEPKILGFFDPTPLLGNRHGTSEVWKNLKKDKILGSIDPQPVDSNHLASGLLLNYLKEFHFRPNFTVYYNTFSFLGLRGSVGWHKDSELDVVVSWLIEKRNIPYYQPAYTELSPSLLVQHRDSVINLDPIDVGSVFVFDTNNYHAWNSNHDCLLFQILVSTCD